jgi:hypothetical protein
MNERVIDPHRGKRFCAEQGSGSISEYCRVFYVPGFEGLLDTNILENAG